MSKVERWDFLLLRPEMEEMQVNVAWKIKIRNSLIFLSDLNAWYSFRVLASIILKLNAYLVATIHIIVPDVDIIYQLCTNKSSEVELLFLIHTASTMDGDNLTINNHRTSTLTS